MLVDIKEIRMIRRAIGCMKPEWRVKYKHWGDETVRWIHADDEVGVYAALLHIHSENGDSQNTGSR